MTQNCKGCGVARGPMTAKKNGRETPKETEREREMSNQTETSHLSSETAAVFPTMTQAIIRAV